MSKRQVTDKDEIYNLLLEDSAMTEAVYKDDTGVYLLGGDGSKRYIEELTMEDDKEDKIK